MVLVGNYGFFVWGKIVVKVVYYSKVLEVVVEMVYFILQINFQALCLKDLFIRKYYECKYGVNVYYGQ